jgi:hypothetical protein
MNLNSKTFKPKIKMKKKVKIVLVKEPGELPAYFVYNEEKLARVFSFTDNGETALAEATNYAKLLAEGHKRTETLIAEF